MKALIVYHTKTGHTREAAEDIASGLAEKGVDCTVEAAGDLNGATADVSGYDIVLVGSPTYGIRRYRRPAKHIGQFLDSLGTDGLKGKVVGAFTVKHPVSRLQVGINTVLLLVPRVLGGLRTTRKVYMAEKRGDWLVSNIEKRLTAIGGEVVTGGPVVKAGASWSLWKGPAAKPADEEAFVEFGRRVAAQAGADT